MDATPSLCGGAISLSNTTTVPADRGQSDPPGNASSLKIRLLSAAVGIPIVLLAIFAGVPGVSAIAVAAAFVAGLELGAMAPELPKSRLRLTAVAVAITGGGVAAAADATEIAMAFLAFGLAAGLTGLLTSLSTRWPGRGRTVVIQFAALYFGLTLAHAPVIAAEDEGRRWILLAILATFAVDTGAYFIGRMFGRHKLAPKISPKKTWEGVFGGAAAAIGAVVALGALLDLPIAAWEAALLGVGVTVAGVSGDLFESWLKRKANVKDSGRIIPGHGGILDRIDSLAPNLVVVYWAVQLLEA